MDPSGHWCEDKQARIDKYKKQGFSEADAEKMANYEKLRETEGVDAAEKYLREQKALSESRGGNKIPEEDYVVVTLEYKEGMPRNEFDRKVNDLKKLGDQGLLYKAENPVSRNPLVTKNIGKK